MTLSVKSKLEKLKDDFLVKMGRLDALKTRLEQIRGDVERLYSKEDTLLKASLFLQSMSDSTRSQVLDKISAIVTDALQTVKDKNLEFRMELVTERNQPDLKFYVYDKATNESYDVLESCGGGIADLVSFALRVSLLVKWSPSLSRVLILDESFKFVSVQDQELLAEFVRGLSERLNLQMILVTHSPTLTNRAHRVFTVSKENGASTVEVRV